MGAAVGAVTGATGYVAERMAAGEEANLADLAVATGTTAVGGFLAGPLGATALRTGAAAVVGINGAFYGGLAAGSIERIAKDKEGTNYCGTNYQ